MKNNNRAHDKASKNLSGYGEHTALPKMQFQPIVVELCTFLAQRHVVLFDDV